LRKQINSWVEKKRIEVTYNIKGKHKTYYRTDDGIKKWRKKKVITPKTGRLE